MVAAPTLANGLVVSSAVRWVRDELVDAAVQRHRRVLADWGMDRPDLDGFERAAWWVSAGHAARLQRSGIALQLTAPGPDWLHLVAERFPQITQRAVWAGTVGDLNGGKGPTYGFAKPAEAKLDDIEARWWDDLDDFVDALRRHPVATAVQVSNRKLSICCEHRVFHAGTALGPSSVYLLDDGTCWEPGLLDCPHQHHDDARRFTADVIAALDGAGLLPPAGTLDVARLHDGKWALIEANPAWCAGWYGADAGQLLDVLVAATDWDHGHPAWAWQPDPALKADADRRSVLRTPEYGAPLGVRILAPAAGACAP